MPRAKQYLAGAISLNSVQMNASRVIGPAIGGLLFTQFGAAWVFALATRRATWLSSWPCGWRLPAPLGSATQGPHRLLEGFR